MSQTRPTQAVNGDGPPHVTRYVIGIDLGTTNCALAYVDLHAASAEARVLDVPQWDGDGTVTTARTLPSFYYLPVKAEWRRGQLKLPFHPQEAPDHAVGRLARLKASQVPGRVIHSAKSWLCHAGVAREDRILPWHADEIIGDERRSPVEVSAAYLEHLRLAWQEALGPDGARFEDQDVTITVPASFDEAAQRLTLQAAARAGFNLERVRLLEEPQAAFYHWLARARQKRAGADQTSDLDELLKPGHPITVLICDIGGGTSDFSLFSVNRARGDQEPVIERIAVSDHLLLGGDNIDLALAYVLEGRLVGPGRKLSSRQWAQLVFETRALKEKALGELSREETAATSRSEDELYVSIAGEGASLFASSMTASLTVAEITQHVLEGFLPSCEANAQPRRTRSGLTTLGLPYAVDTAVSRHLAGFLAGRTVHAVLFTGGSLKPAFVRQRVIEIMTGWQGTPPVVLENDEMDLAVALGAAHYGVARLQPDFRIQGGYPRSLYAEVRRPDGSHALMCIVPKGYDGREPLAITGSGLKAVAGRPVRFQLFSSNRRRGDAVGAVIGLGDDEFHPLPPLHTRLDLGESKRAGERLVEIDLIASMLETGVLNLECAGRGPDEERRWRLDFNVRAQTATEAAYQVAESAASSEQAAPPAIADSRRDKAIAKIDSLYGKKKRPEFEGANPKYLMRDLEEIVGQPRDQWNTGFLRSLWPALEQGMTRRSRSVGHETSWLYLAGYALRPGYGVELDEWRVADLWRAFEMGMSFPKERQVEEQWWIMWRRVAGGLSREQQEAVFAKIYPAIRKGDTASAEMYMLAGSLERIEMGEKVKLGQQLVQQIAAGRKQFLDQKMWALARIGSRVPLYGGPESIVRPKFIEDWYQQLRILDLSRPPYNRLNLFLSQAARIVQDREFDLPDTLRREILGKLRASKAPEEQLRVVQEYVAVDEATRTQLFGESLPAGLVLV